MLPRETSIGLLLAHVHDEFGPDCWLAPATGHAEKTQALCQLLKDAVLDLCRMSEKLLRIQVTNQLDISASYFPKPGSLICSALLAKPGIEHPKLCLEATLVGFGWHGPESIQLELNIGYEHTKTYRWLVANWRRPLSLMLQPLGLEIWDNGVPFAAQGAVKPEYRGKDVLRRTENYLDRSEGDDNQTFSFQTNIYRDTSEQHAALVMAVFLAVYDSLVLMLSKRAKPDHLLKHFLNLRPHLPRISFRAANAFPEFL